MIKILKFALITPLFSSCISVSSYQSARTVRNGEWSGFGGVSQQGLSYVKPSDDSNTDFSALILEGGARIGIGDTSDIGFKYASPNSLSAEFKYMLSDPSVANSAYALGVGVSYASFEIGSGDLESKFTIIDLTVPYFYSFDIDETQALHLSPRVILRSTIVTDVGGVEDSESSPFIGLNVGYNYYGLVLEAGAYTAASGSDAFIHQVTIGYSGSYDVLNRGTVKQKRSRR